MDVGDRAIVPCLRADMADAGSAGGAGKTAVRHHRHRRVQSHPHEHRRRDGKLPHARAALRSFIADHQHRPGFDGTMEEKLTDILLAVEHDRLAAMTEHPRLDAGLFHHGAVGGEIAF